jgi:predicted dehydrogenase
MDHITLLPQVNVISIASRSADKAAATAKQYGIPRHSSYEALLQDPEVEVVYIPLPNSMHATWAIAAMRAGKAVVCEKPLAANADEGVEMQKVVEETGLPFIEAVHYRYHPMAQRLRELVQSGGLGKLHHISIHIHLPSDFFGANDIRFSYNLGGGAAMDPGCYCVNVTRFITGEEPMVVEATPEMLNAEVDRTMTAKLRFPSGCTAELSTSLSKDPWELRLAVTGSKGKLDATNIIVPHFGHEWILQTDGKETRESFDMTPTFVFQWREIADVIRLGIPARTPISDGIANMRVVDDIYRKAGLRIRGLR